MNEFWNNSCNTVCKVNKSTRLRCTAIEGITITDVSPYTFKSSKPRVPVLDRLLIVLFLYLFGEKIIHSIYTFGRNYLRLKTVKHFAAMNKIGWLPVAIDSVSHQNGSLWFDGRYTAIRQHVPQFWRFNNVSHICEWQLISKLVIFE